MKKVALFLITLALFVALAACGGDNAEIIHPSDEPEATETVGQDEPEATETAKQDEPEESDTQKGGTASIITDDDLDENDEASEEIRGGTNQDDAILLPMNVKLYGTTGSGGWYAFTTSSEKKAEYIITTINKTLDSNLVGLNLYDAKGNNLGNSRASDYGKATVLKVKDLTPDTVYYLYIRAGTYGATWRDSDDKIYYRLDIKETGAQAAGYDTSGSLSEARGDAAALEGIIEPGTNQDDAAFIPVNTKIAGTTPGVGIWFAFTTGSTGGTYEFSTVNKTVGSHLLGLNVYDEQGNNLGYSRADDGGKVTTVSVKDLEPDTVYYIRICGGTYAASWHDSDEEIDYTLQINAPEEPGKPVATIEDGLVFKTPFELTETQVMFKSDSAVFVNEAAAKAALAPVAEIILGHPDHKILLAGTTATVGQQEACVKLSNSRAQAVKDLLVKSFGVPESQLLTIGLGYEADPFVRGNDRDANGNFVETEGAKNRRVIVMDADDPIAQELLGK